MRSKVLVVAAVVSGIPGATAPRATAPTPAAPTPSPVGPVTAGPPTPTSSPWTMVQTFDHPRHVRALRARFRSTTHGNPVRYRWEAAPCGGDFAPLPGAAAEGELTDHAPVLPRRRTWFVPGTDACAVRLVVLATNGGPPALEGLEVVEGAANVLRDAEGPDEAFDGVYETAYRGEAGAGRWTLAAHLAHPSRIDRVRLVLGSDAVSVPRDRRPGRDYAIAHAPLAYAIEATEDGTTWFPIARPTVTSRRPLLRVHLQRPVVAVRLVMEGSTNELGLPSPAAGPVVREFEAYAADDARPVVSEPWILSVNANPAGSGAGGPGGERANDVYYAKFLQVRFAELLGAMRVDDRYARAMDAGGHHVEPAPSPSDGRALESIEADDPLLEERFLMASWPPPITVLSGSNDWDYAHKTVISPKGRLRWNPLRPAREGGLGDLASAVKHRAAPFFGFCGGAQLLALLEARTDDGVEEEIDAVLRRNTGRFIRAFVKDDAFIRSWPGEPAPRRAVVFAADDLLFSDLAGPTRRTRTFGFPESHLDMVRPEAFLPGAPLAGFEVLASSTFCSPSVVAGLHAPKDPAGHRCTKVTEVFRSKGGRWPIIGSQFHAEQRDFDRPAPGEPAESVADARLFVAAAYEQVLDAYLR